MATSATTKYAVARGDIGDHAAVAHMGQIRIGDIGDIGAVAREHTSRKPCGGCHYGAIDAQLEKTRPRRAA